MFGGVGQGQDQLVAALFEIGLDVGEDGRGSAGGEQLLGEVDPVGRDPGPDGAGPGPSALVAVVNPDRQQDAGAEALGFEAQTGPLLEQGLPGPGQA